MNDPEKLAELAKALPLVQAYEDLLQPAAKEIGRGLGTVAQTINAALLPLRATIWGFDRIEAWLFASLAQRFAEKPPERIIPPSPQIAGPAIEALRFAANEETLREMYANLLATAMDRESALAAHPAFVEVIRQLLPDEARVVRRFAQQEIHPQVTVWADLVPGNGIDTLRHFSALPFEAACVHPELGPSYVENISRLGLATLDDGNRLTDSGAYDWLLQRPEVVGAVARANAMPGRSAIVTEGMLKVSVLGQQFVRVCITSP